MTDRIEQALNRAADGFKPARPALRRTHLVRDPVPQGLPQVGQESALSVGRSRANDLVLADVSVSGQHFRVRPAAGENGDRVTVGVSPYDPVRGIITFRAR